jgi:hypothetical protein
MVTETGSLPITTAVNQVGPGRGLRPLPAPAADHRRADGDPDRDQQPDPATGQVVVGQQHLPRLVLDVVPETELEHQGRRGPRRTDQDSPPRRGDRPVLVQPPQVRRQQDQQTCRRQLPGGQLPGHRGVHEVAQGAVDHRQTGGSEPADRPGTTESRLRGTHAVSSFPNSVVRSLRASRVRRAGSRAAGPSPEGPKAPDSGTFGSRGTSCGRGVAAKDHRPRGACR